MSVYRHINGKNNDREFLKKKLDYITDPVKTNGGKLVGSYACMSEHGIDDWLMVKKVHHKSGGKQGEHIVLSLTPDRKSVSDEEYMKVAEEVAECVFHGYNCIYSVHTDSKTRHMHFLVNSVSFETGLRYHSSKSDLAATKATVNRVLGKHGFDIIRSNAENMIDNTPYDLEKGMEVLEITDDKPDKNPFVDILVDASDDEEFFGINETKEPSEVNPPVQQDFPWEHKENYYEDNCYDYPPNHFGMDNNYNYYEREYPTMMNNNSVFGANSFNPTPANTQFAAQPVSISAPPALQQTAQNAVAPYNQSNSEYYPAAYPTMTLNLAPKITINAPASATCEQLKSYLNAATPKLNSSNSLKCAVVMAEELNKRGVPMNIETNIFPDVVLNIGTDYDDSSVIDITPNTP